MAETTTERTKADVGSRPTVRRSRRPRFSDAFDSRSNSLNFIRLLLASTVVFSHSLSLGGYGTDLIGRKTTIATIAVYGFFGISGYLITASADHNRLGRYLWQRFLRIFPGFWVCLLVTAFGFALLGWLHSGRAHCDFTCYTTGPDGAYGFVVHNLYLKMNQQLIGHSLGNIPDPLAWNGSLWTLFYEFLCYLVIGGIAVIGMLRFRPFVALLATSIWLLELMITATPSLNQQFGPLSNWVIMNLLVFLPVFLTGSAIYLFRDKIPDSGLLALACVGVFVLSLALPLGNKFPAYTMTSSSLLAPALAYPMMWLGTHLPGRRIGSRNDYSYGVYIYAFPAAQLLAVWGAYRWGYVAYTGLTFAFLAPFAVASWWFVEKPSLRLKRIRMKGAAAEPVPPAASPAASDVAATF